MRLYGKLGGCLLAATVIAGMVPAGSAMAAPAKSPSGGLSAQRGFSTVTLVTGDQLTVSTDGSNRVAVKAGKGREHVGFVQRLAGGHLTVTPADALPLVRSGRLDSRLFDVTSLIEFGYDDRRADLPLILSGSGGNGIRANAINGATVVRDLPAIGGTAVRQNRRDAGAFWNSVTAGSGIKSLRADVDKVWLDGKRKPSLDVSVPQIGAPAAWQAGYTGKDVTAAVVDTGIDDTHPDLAGKVARPGELHRATRPSTTSGTAPMSPRRSPAPGPPRPASTRASHRTPSCSTARSATGSTAAPSPGSSPACSGRPSRTPRSST